MTGKKQKSVSYQQNYMEYFFHLSLLLLLSILKKCLKKYFFSLLCCDYEKKKIHKKAKCTSGKAILYKAVSFYVSDTQ